MEYGYGKLRVDGGDKHGMIEPLRLTGHKEPILAYISPAQRDLLQWLQEKMPFGTATITTQYGEPEGAKEPLASVKFGR